MASVWSPARRVLFLTVFIDLLGFGIVVPMLGFCAKQYGASGVMLGMILGSFSLMQFLFSSVWGRLSDRIGRRPVIMISLAGNILGFSVFAFASNVPMLFVSRILCGIAAASVSAAQAYIADTTDDTNRSAGMALIGMAFGLGIVLGPPLGGLLSGFFSSPNFLPGAVAAGLSAVAFAMAAFALPESNPRPAQPGRWSLLDHESWMIFFRLRGLRLAGASLAALMFTLASLAPILILVGRDRFALSAREVGYLFGLMGLVVVLLQVSVTGRLARRIGDVGTCIGGAVALMAGLIVVPFTHSRGALVVAACLMGVGQALCNPALSAYISKISPPKQRGAILGVSTSLNSLARVIGPAAAGLAYDALRAPGALLSQAAVVALGIVLSLRLIFGSSDLA